MEVTHIMARKTTNLTTTHTEFLVEVWITLPKSQNQSQEPTSSSSSDALTQPPLHPARSLPLPYDTETIAGEE